jgi:histidinol dehydrogenase
MKMRMMQAKQYEIKREEEYGSTEQNDAAKAIIREVREGGDEAVRQWTRRLDKVELTDFRVSEEEVREAHGKVDAAFLDAIAQAANNIRRFHEQQKRHSWTDWREDGSVLGQIVRPLERVGMYVPGGKAAYPSTMLMNVIPAQVAGVPEIVIVTPPATNGEPGVSPYILATAGVLGVKEIYCVGGAQAIAALAYGTESIRPVDKIVGPGNIYVSLAKKYVFGVVDIDKIAGPTDVVILADEQADPQYVAADLLAQAEHDEMSPAILITPSERLGRQVQAEVERRLAGEDAGAAGVDAEARDAVGADTWGSATAGADAIDKDAASAAAATSAWRNRGIAAKAIADRGAILLVDDLQEGIETINRLAPEHVELLLADPLPYVGGIRNAGAIFLGAYSPEPVGDYFAGPNHVLPTNGSARFASPLGVDDFIKKSSVIYYSKQALLANGPQVVTLAKHEGFDGHAAAIQVRLDKEKEGKANE